MFDVISWLVSVTVKETGRITRWTDPEECFLLFFLESFFVFCLFVTRTKTTTTEKHQLSKLFTNDSNSTHI